jgi:hypothetical protein
MYKSLEINNFKGLCGFALDRIGKVNLIAGVNNVGKTTLLEAIFLHGGAYNPALTLSIDQFRGFSKFHFELGGSDKVTPWDSLFNDFDISNNIEIKAEFTDNTTRKIDLQIVGPSEESVENDPLLQYDASGSTGPLHQKSVPTSPESALVLRLNYEESSKKPGSSFLILGPKGLKTSHIKSTPHPMIFLPARYRVNLEEDADRFGKLEIVGRQNMLLDALKVIEPRLERIAVVALSGQPVLYGDIGLSRMLKLPYMGDGMSRLASYVLAIGNAKDGVVLIDEIENGFHHTMMPKVWEAIAKAAKDFNTQVFATTHSLECIVSAYKAFSKGEYYGDLLVHRLEREDDDAVKDVTFVQDDLKTAFELGIDLRGVRR